MRSARRPEESGSALIAVLLALGFVTTLILASTGGPRRQTAAAAAAERLGDEARSAHAEAFEVVTALFRRSAFADGVPAVYPEPYVAPFFKLTAPRGTVRGGAWSLVGGCVLVRRPLATDLARTGGRYVAETEVCPEAVERPAAQPFRIAAVTMRAVTKVAEGKLELDPGVARAGKLELDPVAVVKPIKSKAKVPVAPPPPPTCEIEAPDSATLWKSFDVRLRAFSVATIGWVHGGRATGSPFQIATNGVANLLGRDQAGKLGRIVGERRLRANPTHVKMKLLGASMSMRVVGGVEGVLGAGSRASCHKDVKLKLPWYVQLLRVLTAVSMVPSPYTCFAPGTMIRLADGSEKAIEALAPGERLASPLGREAPVVARIVKRSYAGRIISVKTGEGVVRVTPEHAFLTEDGVRAAGDLRAFDRLAVAGGGFTSDVALGGLERHDGFVYNVELATTSDDAADHVVVAGGVVAGDLALQGAAAEAAAAREALEGHDLAPGGE